MAVRFCGNDFGVEELELLQEGVRRYSSLSSRDANRLEVGRTTGRGRMERGHRRDGHAPTTVWRSALCADARLRLREQCAAPAEAASA